MREAKCFGCQERRKKVIIAKAMERYDLVESPRDRLYLWTFGTSLQDTKENRDEIRRYWKLFVRRLAHVDKSFDPLMNSMEAGTKGDRLHYHVVARGYLEHAKAVEIWRDITGEKSNVNFSGRGFSPRKAVRTFSYLAKYASKGYAYYWMGSLFKVTPEKFQSTSEHFWRYDEEVGELDLLYVKIGTDFNFRQQQLDWG